MDLTLFTDIPDPQGIEFPALVEWLNSRITIVRQTSFAPEIVATCVPCEYGEAINHPCGAEGSAIWRKFFLATLLADWVSYESDIDRADFARLKYIMTTAYKYTRLWFCRLADGKWIPVGYTSWYPIAKFIYDGVRNHPETIDDRGIVMPSRFIKTEDIRHAYVFNISIAKELHDTRCSRKLVRGLRRDGLRVGNAGLLAIVVGSQGKKLSHQGNFMPVGEAKVQGEIETIYARDPL